MATTAVLTLLALATSVIAKFDSCPLGGPAFVAPASLGGDEFFGSITTNISNALDEALKSGNSSHGPFDGNNTAYSVSIFSIDDPALLWEWHHTPEILRNGSFGVHQVDADSVYRIGSISKLMTVYTLLAAIGDGYWNRPVTDFIPELQARAKEHNGDVLDYVQWEEVTLGQLAGQNSGLTRDFQQDRDDLSFVPYEELAKNGFPPLPQNEIPRCLTNDTKHPCDRSLVLANIDSRQPVWATDSIPTYSNTAFEILSYALESIVGAPFDQIMNEILIDPLHLNRTFSKKPDNGMGVIPLNPWNSYWNGDLGSASPAGNFYASTKDLATIGRSILASTILPAKTTRAWLKPHALTTSLLGAVGLPWEIYRASLYGERVTDLYTKGGSLGVYTSNLALLPDYGVGYTVFAAGAGNVVPVNGIVADILVPGLEEVARLQTEASFSGQYVATNGLNSSIKFSTEPGVPGLAILEWISNGTEVLKDLSRSQLGQDDALAMRVYPTNLKRTGANGLVDVAWRGVLEFVGTIKDQGPFSACSSWFGVDSPSYGRHAIDQLVFTVDEDGRAVSVEPRAFKIVLERVE